MIDTENQKLKEGDKVSFHIDRYFWKGEVIEINEAQEVATFLVTERETGVGMTERLNYIECQLYITIENEPASN